jgi:ParB family chromosome partitioning protein
MMTSQENNNVRMIPVDRIRVLNPRDRNIKKFREIVDSISRVGLKRPITVTPFSGESGDADFDLVCGQGRLEAFQVLKQAEIPAIVIEASREDCYLMSLVENLARRQHNSLELMRDIGTLAERGYNSGKIATKTGLTREWVNSVLHLMKKGEERLVAAVERNQIPVSVAVEIANAGDDDIQRALSEAYERKELRGNRLSVARRIVQARRRHGKGLRKFQSEKHRKRKITANAMIRAYKQETERQRAMVRKSDLTEHRLMFLVSAVKELFGDENFITLLRAEGLDTVPNQIAHLIQQQGLAP